MNSQGSNCGSPDLHLPPSPMSVLRYEETIDDILHSMGVDAAKHKKDADRLLALGLIDQSAFERGFHRATLSAMDHIARAFGHTEPRFPQEKRT